MKPIARSSLYEGKYAVLREQLRARREAVGLTQAGLAARLDKSQHYVSRTELGDHRLDVIELETYCEALGLDMMEFWRQLSVPPVPSSSTPSQFPAAPSPAKSAPQIGASATRRVERARVLLEESCLESCPEPLSIEQVAAQLGWSADHLRRMMRLVLGQTPQQIQIAARLRYGQKLLLDSGVAVSQVALACGFATSSHFAHAFKAAFGCSPREFRFNALHGRPLNNEAN